MTDTGRVPPGAPTKFDEFCERAREIQRGCVCISWSARECLWMRHSRWPAEDFDHDHDEACECGCHDAIRDMENDLWPTND